MRIPFPTVLAATIRVAVALALVTVTATAPATVTATAPATVTATTPAPDAVHTTGTVPPTDRTTPPTTRTAANGSSPAASGTTTARRPPDPAVVALYPNPVAAEDRGEFVVIRPPPGPANLTLSDGETGVTVSVPPPASQNGSRLVVSPHPTAARNLTDRPVVGVSRLALSNAGERLHLRRNGTVLDVVEYAGAPEGERWVRRNAPANASGPATGRWRPLGLDERAVRAFGPASTTTFVLPDASDVPAETLRGADARILLAGYTFTSDRIADALVAAERRGVRVRVLVDGTPVGEASAQQAAALDRLAAAGVDVEVVAGPHARFDYHHPKYAVVDDRALVLTENWKPAGTGGRGSRGWGVRVDSPAVTADLASLFRADAGWRDTSEWERFREGRRFEFDPAADGSYPAHFSPRRVEARAVHVLTAPGNAEGAVRGLVDGADRRVDVVQPTVGGRSQPLLRACVRAARRGVDVRILLSGAWYVEEENRALADRLNDLARRADLPLELRVAEPNGRFEKVHAKGAVVDDTVVVGSLNWNNNSARENREVALALEGTAAAAYYREVFEADWHAGRGDSGNGGPPVALAFAAVGALALAAAYVRRYVRFEP